MEAPSARFLQNCSYFESKPVDDFFVNPGKIDFSGEPGFLSLPNGTTAQRGVPNDARIRFNTTTSRYEVTSGGIWCELAINGGGVNGVIGLNPSSGNIAWNVSQGDRIYNVTLTGNATLEVPVNFVPGAEFTLVVHQDGNGGHELTFAPGYVVDFRSLNAPVTFSSPNAISIFKVWSDGSGSYYVSLVFISPEVTSWQDFEQLTTLTEANGLIAWPMATRLAEVTLTAPATLSAPSGQLAGREYTLIVKQDSAGGHTLTFDPAYTMADPSAQPNPAANKATVFKFDCDGPNIYGFSTLPST